MHKAKFSMPMVILAIATLILSSYGLFALAHDYGNVPTALAILVVAGFDLFAIAAGHHAMTIARDGDSAGPWNLAVVGAAVLSAVLQYTHTQLAGQPWAVGVMMAMFPIATVTLFEGTLRRAHRLNGRRTGRVAQPRASFELLQWIVYPRQTWTAFRLGVADRSLGGDAAFKLGMVARVAIDQGFPEPMRRQIDLDYDLIVPGYPQLVSGDSGGQASGPSGGSGADRPNIRTITDLVRESMQVNGTDRAAIVADVLAARPEVSEDTIRRTIRKESVPRSA